MVSGTSLAVAVVVGSVVRCGRKIGGLEEARKEKERRRRRKRTTVEAMRMVVEEV